MTHDRRHIRIENVRAHTGYIADVITHIVRYDGRVTRIIFFEVELNFTHKVGPYVGSFRVDTAARLSKEREGTGAKAKAQDHLGIPEHRV
jgi:hypothetical protein